jgi:hypothetical protein
MSNASKTLVRRLVDEVINQGNLGVVDELFASQLAALARQAFTAFRSAFPRLARGDRRAHRRGGQGRGALQVLGHPAGALHGRPTHRQAPRGGRDLILRVKGGRVVDFWGLEDDWSRLQQLGLVKAPTPATS